VKWMESGCMAACALGISGWLTARAQEVPGILLDDLESRVRSTLLFGGSSPVSFSGEARLRLQEHDFSDYPGFMVQDRSWTQANWEGNESLLRLGMVVRAGRNTVLWSKLGFQSTLPGNFLNADAGPGNDGFKRAQGRHDKVDEGANIHEDMAAGLAVRTVPASFWLRMGNVIWTEASPLTIWKDQARTFAWDYLPYEIEQPVGRYYEYNIAKGEKTGRAAWNKKPFNGINFQSIDLPGRLYLNIVYGSFERYDNFEREFIDFSNDLGYADQASEAKQRGTGDTYRHLYHGRLARDKALGKLTLGFNTVGILYQADVALNRLFRNNFGIRDTLVNDTARGRTLRIPRGEGFYKEPQTYSLDLKGMIGDDWEIHGEAAVNRVDTTWLIYRMRVDASALDSLGRPAPLYAASADTRHSLSDPLPAFFARVKYRRYLPMQADLAWIPRGFYSPFSFAAPVDAFIPFGANLVGAGKFVARGEGSPYVQNMAGLMLSLSPNVGYGHFRIGYGQHFQPEPSRDVLYFPYRLNGQDLFGMFHSSYNRWGNDLVDQSMQSGRYAKRLGDESFRTQGYQNPLGPEAGGLRSDYLTMYEGFVPYASAAQADSNGKNPTQVMTRSPFVPSHRKWTFNFNLDGAYDVGPALGYSRDVFLSAYFSLNGISTAFRPMAFGPSDMLLWGSYARLEPAIALSDKFYLLALGGFENWRSERAYRLDPVAGAAVAAPIDYRDWALGAGFDWDFASRVGLHGRLKWMKHEDKWFSDNSWTNRLASAELKMWF
jgi:hypothetical protein